MRKQLKPHFKNGHGKPWVRNWRELPAPKRRQCNQCSADLPFNLKYFPPRKRCPWGLSPVCRNCTNSDARRVNMAERLRLKIDVLSRYGLNGQAVCACPGCGESHLEFLTLDHVNGGGKHDRALYPGSGFYRRLRRLNYPPGYRTLCCNCNHSYGHYRYCPHCH